TSLFGSRLAWLALQRARASATSGLACSAACRVFFEGDLMALEEPPDRHLGRLDANPFEYPPLKLGQSQIALSGAEIQKPCRMGLQRRAAFAATRPGGNAACLAVKLPPAHRRCRAHFEPLRRLPPRRSRRNLRHHPRPQILRPRLAHVRLRIRGPIDS